MKIKDILAQNRPTLSIEIFPPKSNAQLEDVLEAAQKMSRLNPSFMSVTYGAGGSTSKKTAEISSYLTRQLHIPALAHLTCISLDQKDIPARLDELSALGIENILALRGDYPEDYTPIPGAFSHASDLISAIKAHGDFCVGAACYPEGHPEAASISSDIAYLKAKQEAGCDFFTTQMFFDNGQFYSFLYRLREAGITVPVVAGIMPLTNAAMLRRTIKLSGANMPTKFRSIVDRFGDDPAAMKQAGIAYATDQIIDLLANGFTHIHLYSMNKPDIAEKIIANLSDIIILDPAEKETV